MSCQPDVAVITNDGISHIENLGFLQENILRRSLRYLTVRLMTLPRCCRDDKLLAGCSYILTKFQYYSVSRKDYDVYTSGVKTVDNSITFTINYEGGKIAAQINYLRT